MRAYKISNNPKYVYQLSTSKYQAYKDVNNMSIKDINISELRERWAIRNTGELFRGSSHLLYVFSFIAMKDFHKKWSRKITQCRNTYNEALKNSWTSKFLTCSRKNNTRGLANSPRLQPLQLLNNKGWNTWWSYPLITKKILSQTGILEDGYSNG